MTETRRLTSLSGRPILFGFKSPFIPKPVGGATPRVKLISWTSPDGLPHLVSFQVFLNNSMDSNRIPGTAYVPTAVIACVGTIEWQTDAGDFNAEIDIHFGQSVTLVAQSLTLSIIEESAPSALPTNLATGTLNYTAALSMGGGQQSSVPTTRSFSFFSLAGLGAAGDAVLPVTVFVPNFARQVIVNRSNDPADALVDLQIRVDTVPVGRRSAASLGAGGDLGEPIALFNGATSVRVNSTGNPQGVNVIFLLDF